MTLWRVNLTEGRAFQLPFKGHGIPEGIGSVWASLPVTGTSLCLLLPGCKNILIFILATLQNALGLVLTYTA